MSIGHFFVNRPKFAFVISIVITLAGLLSLFTLPINMYPQIAPPSVKISAIYPGASAQVVEEAIINPIEKQVNGVEGMINIESSATSDGAASITVTFQSGTDVTQAQVNVQNRVAIAEPSLPGAVRQQGVIVKAQSSNMLLGINLLSPDDTFDEMFLSNYALKYLKGSLARIEGISKVEVMGAMTYSMRVWLQPIKMSALGITVHDIHSALQSQNATVAAGKFGQGPTRKGQQFEYIIQTPGRLQSAEEFNHIVLRAKADGSVVRLGDVAKIELGAQSYHGRAKLNGGPTSFIVIYQSPTANATQVAERVYQEMDVLAKSFPKGLEYDILYDTTEFIKRSIDEVATTLYQAIFLVILVVFLFLQNWRMTLIPAVAIPVSLVGTFAVMNLLGYSINTISLFGLVMAIGIVVDDAIIVIENVERHISAGMSPREATMRTMSEVSGAVIATTLVLLAVFIPVGFMPGMTGTLYKQFSTTISVAVCISSINALTLSPALCATLLKPGVMVQVKWLRPFERLILGTTKGYTATVSWMLNRTTRMGVLFLVLLVGTGLLFKGLPTGFVPNEDQGFLFVNIQLPDAASINRTDKLLEKITPMVQQASGVKGFITVSGFSLLAGAGSNNALGIVVLDSWDERTTPETSIGAIAQHLQGLLSAVPEAQIMVFEVPPIPGLGSTGGFDLRLQDTRDRTVEKLAQVANGLIYQANQQPQLNRVYHTYRADVPQYALHVDRDKAMAMGINLGDIFQTLQTQLGSLYVNDFTHLGRSYRVIVQAQSDYRANPDDLNHYYVRNHAGEMVPLSTVVTLTPALGPTAIHHFNLYRSVSISGQAGQGYSSGDAIRAVDKLAGSLPDGYTFQWAGQSRQEIEAGNLAPLLFGLAIVFVYLFLVAQYESWNIPFVVIAAVPIALFGAALGLLMLGMVNNIYAQIGMVLLIGIAAKTAILIVEFAMEQRSGGMDIARAAETAARLRFRAVIMTALSFVLGILPLLVATGPGAASRISLGATVFCGMTASMVIGTLMTPVLYRIVQAAREYGGRRKRLVAPAP